jgi:heme exporter protein A
MSFMDEGLGASDQRIDMSCDSGLSPSTLQWRGLVCARGGRRLFGPLSAGLGPGHLLWVRGANGAGKTSLLRILAGLMTPAEGEVLWQGQPIQALQEEFNQQLIYLGHAAALKDDLSPLENLLFAGQLGGQHTGEAAARHALALAGLRGKEDAHVRYLSQGQRRRSALARLCLDVSASLWILDEPFNALDRDATTWLSETIRAHLERSGMVVLTTHQDVPVEGLGQKVLDL